MAEVTNYRCSICGREFTVEEIEYTCPACGQLGTMDVLYNYEALRSTLDRDALKVNPVQSMWRYRDLLPLQSDSPVPPLRVGNTPLYDVSRLAADLGLRGAWVKDDGSNPTGSLKDRASAMIIARAKERGITTVSTASTGNAAAALSGIGASVDGMNIIIFVPATAPEAKIAQLLVYGATVLLVEDSYDTAFDLCYQMCVEQGWYCRNTAMNPYTIEGKKTAAFEIAEQLNWEVPDVVIVGVGDGNIIAGVHKGFWDLYQLGWISRIPRLIGVQAEGSSPLVKAWETGTSAGDMHPVHAHTIADSISAGLPRDRSKALRAVRETGGAFVAIPDDQTIASIPKVARLTGVFCEPSCAITYAGARRALELGYLSPDERVVFLMTGNGLKDVRCAQESVTGGLRVAPNLDAIRRALKLG